MISFYKNGFQTITSRGHCLKLPIETEKWLNITEVNCEISMLETNTTIYLNVRIITWNILGENIY